MFSNDCLLSYISGCSRVPVIEYCLMWHSVSWFPSRPGWRRWGDSYWQYKEGLPFVLCWPCRCAGDSFHLLPSFLATTKGTGPVSSCVCATQAAVAKPAQDKAHPSCHHVPRASWRCEASQWCPVRVLSVVLDVLWAPQMCCVCSFIAEERLIRLERTLECMSALRESPRKSLGHGWDIYFLHGSHLHVPSHNASDCSAMLVVLLVTNMLTQSQKCSLQGVDV